MKKPRKISSEEVKGNISELLRLDYGLLFTRLFFDAFPIFKNLKKESRKRYVAKGFFDIPFFLLVVTIVSVGFLMMSSASYMNAFYDPKNITGGDPYYYCKRQILFILIGIAVMLIVSMIRYDFFRDIASMAMVVSIILLVAVLIIGKADGEEIKRWIRIGPIGIQPSEIAKVALVLFCAWASEKKQKKVRGTVKESFFAATTSVIMIGVVCSLIILEKHLSATVLVFLIGAMMLFSGGYDIKALLIWGVVGLVLVGVVLAIYPDIIAGYMIKRMESWQNDKVDVTDEGWQNAQSLNAISSGGLFGLGLGKSLQKFLYVSEPQNDFVFAIACEELGFVRASLIILLYVLLVWRGFVIAMRSKSTFSALLVMGIVFQVGLQAALNIAVVTELIPNTGISLPFFSYGGTSLVILMAEMGMVLSVSKYSKLEKTNFNLSISNFLKRSKKS